MLILAWKAITSLCGRIQKQADNSILEEPHISVKKTQFVSLKKK